MMMMIIDDDDDDDVDNDEGDDDDYVDDDVKQQLIEQIYLLDMSCSHIINTHFARIIISTVTIHLCLLSHHI